MPYLIQKKPDGSIIKQWDLQGKPLIVGRGEKVDVQIVDIEMSRQHFIILPQGNGYVIQDMKSRNGTTVNGQRVAEAPLKPDSNIRAGNSLFVFVDGLGTVMKKIEKGSTRYSTYVRKISKNR